MKFKQLIPAIVFALMLITATIYAEETSLSPQFPAVKEKNWFKWRITLINSSEKGDFIGGIRRPKKSLTEKTVVDVNVTIDKITVGETILVEYSFTYSYDMYRNNSLFYSGAAGGALKEEFQLNSTQVIHLTEPEFLFTVPVGLFINVEIARNMKYENETMQLYGQKLNLMVFRNSTSISIGPNQVINTTTEQKYEKEYGALAGYLLKNVTFSRVLREYTLSNVTIVISLKGSNILIRKVAEAGGIPVETYYLIIGFVALDAILAFIIYKKK